MTGLTINDSEMLVWEPTKTTMQVKLGELVQYFQIGIKCNDSGIPRAYIDPTVLMPHLLEIEQPDDLDDGVVEQAHTAISFEDGFPTIEGIPFWERLEGEALPYYKMFKEYREMKYVGESNKTGALTRSIAKLSENSGMAGRQLNALSRVYHWQVRAKAYDNYKSTERQLARVHEVELMEVKHAKISNKLLDQAVDYLTDHPEQLSPKVAIELVNLAMRSGRLALGLNPDKPGSSSGEGRGSGTNINITNQANAIGDGGTMNQLNADGLSPVEQKTQDNSKDVTHLQSILHVLNQSGAFANAVMDKEEESEIIEADYK
jgi:hypothetical protein